MSAVGAAPAEVVHPPRLSLPAWPAAPEPVSREAAAYLVVALGPEESTRSVAGEWAAAAAAIAPVTSLRLATMASAADRAALQAVLAAVRTGWRILVVGGQYDVLQALAAIRDAGAIPAELTSFVVHTRDLPAYCAQCRTTNRVAGAPGDEVECPGCGRTVAIHPHLSAALGSFLASDARARDIAVGELASEPAAAARPRPRPAASEEAA